MSVIGPRPQLVRDICIYMEYMEVCFNANFKDTMDKRRVYTRGNKKNDGYYQTYIEIKCNKS